jgi:hypothetical protein
MQIGVGMRGFVFHVIVHAQWSLESVAVNRISSGFLKSFVISA